MKRSGLVVLTVLLLGLTVGFAQNPKDRTPAPQPPVQRTAELEDSVIVTLPGGTQPTKPAKTVEASAPAPAASPAQKEEKSDPVTPVAPADAVAAAPATPATVSGWSTAPANGSAPAATADPVSAAPATGTASAPAGADLTTAAPATGAASGAATATDAASAPPAAADATSSPATPPANAPELPVAAGTASAPAVAAASAPPAVPDAGPAPAHAEASPAAPHAAGPDTPAGVAPPAKAKPVLPEDLLADPGIFCQKRIGQWREADARTLFGEPTGTRPSLDENSVENGRILSFADPTGQFQQLELDFDKQNGRLRTVFVYPHNLTWTECRRLWGGKVNASLAKKGRRFYSYMDKKLDVLVDPSGKVISLGLY